MAGPAVRTPAPSELNDLLARIIETSAEGVAVATSERRDGRVLIVYANDALGRMLGVEADTLVGSDVERIVGRAPELAGPDATDGRTGGRIDHRRSDGSSVRLEWRSMPVLDGDAHRAIFVHETAATDDDPDRDLVAMAEQRTRELVEQVPAIFYEEVPSPEGETFYVSPQIEEILGVSPLEYRTNHEWWRRHLHPEDRDRMVAEYEARLADRSMPVSWSSEYRLVRPDGRVVWVDDRETIVRDEDGVAVMVRGAMFDVTAQKEAEARLQDAEIRYRTLVEQLPLITYLWEVDPAPGDNPAYYTSPQITSILGYTPEEWNEDPEGWRALIHPGDRARVLASAARSESTGEPFVEEYRYVHKDGRSVWVHDESIVIRRTAGGAPWIFQGVMYDITARIESEARLAAAEEQYRNLVERMPAVTYVWDARATADDNRNYTSPQIEGLLGYTAEDWESDPARWQESLHPDDAARVLAATARAAETGTPWIQEFRYVHRDGREVWVHDEAALSGTDPSGRPRLFEGVMFDITDRVEADRALQESLASFRALAEGAPVGIFRTDAEGRCTYVNGRWCEVAGMDETSASGAGWASAIHPEDREEVLAAWAAAVEGARAFEAEFRFRRPDGESRWVRSRAVGVTDPRGGVTGYVGTVDDVTDRRATEEELRLIRSAVEHAGHAVMISELARAGEPAPIVYVNPAFSRMTGFEPAEVVGRPAATFTDAPAEIPPAAGPGSDEVVETRLMRKHGAPFTAEGVVSPVRTTSGAASHVVAILRDATQIREVERSLRESLEELRRADADRRQALAQIVEAQEQELDRMAEGIEDRSLQQMTAVRMRMETLRRNLSDPAQLGALDKLEGSVEQAVGQLRGLLSELRPRELATEGLEGAIREYLDRAAGPLRTEVTGGLADDPEPSQGATAFRVVQEAVTSAVEVRAASWIAVRLEAVDDGFAVTVRDDGASWTTVHSATMADRAGLAGGRCRRIDAPEGSTVELWLPLRAPLAGETPLRPSGTPPNRP